ncbi:MAG: hypothetical protein ACXWXK_06410 [Actinomycetota bacterium]
MGLRRAVLLFALAGAVMAFAPVPVRAQSSSPSAPPVPQIDGEVSGSLRPGGTLSVRSDVTMPGGWQGLHLIEVIVLSGGREIERMTYEVESSRLEIGGNRILIGACAESAGAYLRVCGPGVIVTTGGAYLSIQIHADVLRTVPPGARFRLSVTGDAGTTAQVTRTLAPVEDDRGFGWDVVLAAVAAALLAGAFAGNLVASRRRPPPRLSVYGVIQQRLDADPPVTGRER